jgi:lipoprotein-anchoring transpeptidase ErfK/SrfK
VAHPSGLFHHDGAAAGAGRGGKGSNWTDGCVALADEDMDRLFAAVAPGTPVTIVGRARVPGEVEGGPERE